MMHQTTDGGRTNLRNTENLEALGTDLVCQFRQITYVIGVVTIVAGNVGYFVERTQISRSIDASRFMKSKECAHY